MTAPWHRTPSSERAKGSPIPHLLAGRVSLRLPGALALCAIVLVAGCTAGVSPSPPAGGTPSAGAPAPSASPSIGASFPLTLRDDEGTAVTIERRPTRIASLSPANTEILWALGAGGRQVGGTDFDDYPAAAVELPDIASYSGVDVERIVDLEADLVLAAGNAFNPPDSIRRLRSLGIPVVVVYAADVAGVLADIELIGAAIGEGPAAVALTAAMGQRIDAVSAAATATGTRPRTFYELDATGAIYGPADESFVVGMIELAGGDPITTGSPTVFQISLERLVAADPEVIVLGDAAYGVTPELVAARPGWGGMTAVRDGAIRPVDDIVVTRPGPRLADGLLALARAIHPEIPSDLGL